MSWSSRCGTAGRRTYGAVEAPAGFDCSGFVRYVYAQLGVTLPHNAAMQYQLRVSGLPRAISQPGDLVFFDRLRHNGIYIGEGRFIHAKQTGKYVADRGSGRRLVPHALVRRAPALTDWHLWNVLMYTSAPL